MPKNLPRCEDSFPRMTQEDKIPFLIQFPLISVNLIFFCFFNSQQSLCVDKQVTFYLITWTQMPDSVTGEDLNYLYCSPSLV